MDFLQLLLYTSTVWTAIQLLNMKVLPLLLCLTTVICVSVAFSSGRSRTPQCGYDSCPKLDPSRINVHIVPHTHDDVGWLKTVDQYYYGSRSNIQKAGVQYILDTVVQALLADPERRFIYVESAFFFKWWREQTSDLRDKVKQLVEEGRLEFIGGAWSMNDEAIVHYQSVIDQFTYGLKRLNDTFGQCARPRVGWQIDPFGHTREMASLFAQMGFDGMFFGRLDYQDKTQRLQKKEAEMIWRGSANLGAASDLFTGVLYNNYGPPPGFCFDILCSDEPMIDDPDSQDYNIDRRLDSFFKYVSQQSRSYRTRNIIITSGGDFTYMDANVYFKNLDKLIRYANEAQKNGSDFNLVYSTPSCYLKSLHDAQITWPTKTDDFIPYASDLHSFWTGYYTSKPALKRLERIGNNFLQICKQLTTFAAEKSEKSLKSHLDYFSEVMGILQHHDAVTGTSKEHVTKDYTVKISSALNKCSDSAKIVLNQLSKGDTFDFDSCLLLNVSHCEISETKQKFMVTVYNALAQSTSHYVRIPVNENYSYEVIDHRSVTISHQIVSVPPQVTALHPEQGSGCELVFLATEIPPVGYKSFFIVRTPSHEESSDSPKIAFDQISSDGLQESPKDSDVVTIGNKYLSVVFDAEGLVSSISLADGSKHKLSQNFFYYEGADRGNGMAGNRNSGAYVFKPKSSERLVAKQVSVKVIKGPLVEEVHQIFNDWVSQIVRVYRDYNHVEFEWLINTIPVKDRIGKEIVSRFVSDIASSRTFYTDSNGREMIRRVRNQRETWNLLLQEKISGNYYPVTTNIAIEDLEKRLSVLTDRAQGGSSLQDGAVELMVHRRLLHDDAFGVGEPLNDPNPIRGKHFLLFGKLDSVPTMAARERFLQAEKLLSPWLFFSDASSYEYEDWRKISSHLWSGMTLSLPQNVKLLTLEPWDEQSFLVRFEHILEHTDDPEYSKSVTFNFKDVFGLNFDINNIEEMTLAGNQRLQENIESRFTFKPDQESDNASVFGKKKRQTAAEELQFNPAQRLPDDITKWNITLEPMQIRTFILHVNPSIRNSVNNK
ncbi:lysosomal alpha-mannosidase-like [Phlebotomus argentipes]|uniref:lysosomal alpha-mannosidase-like n=1 Tax=Phlebotomus argentipes TaxID=94469 RepID=UPI002892E7B4|nr:lysosomal alpha-mannosidase-like [Phlebotomus argentipes]